MLRVADFLTPNRVRVAPSSDSAFSAGVGHAQPPVKHRANVVGHDFVEIRLLPISPLPPQPSCDAKSPEAKFHIPHAAVKPLGNSFERRIALASLAVDALKKSDRHTEVAG